MQFPEEQGGQAAPIGPGEPLASFEYAEEAVGRRPQQVGVSLQIDQDAARNLDRAPDRIGLAVPGLTALDLAHNCGRLPVFAGEEQVPGAHAQGAVPEGFVQIAGDGQSARCIAFGTPAHALLQPQIDM